VIKYSLAGLGHCLSGDQIEKSMREKETAKAFLLVQASTFAIRHPCGECMLVFRKVSVTIIFPSV